MPFARALATRLAVGVGIAVGLFVRSGGAESAAAPPAAALDLLRSEPLRTEPETRFIRLAQGKRPHLVQGWGPAEWNRELDIHYVWADARRSSLWFRVLDVQELQALVRLVPFPTPEPQKVTVIVNGEPVAELAPRPGFLEYRFLIPARVLRKGRNVLAFRHAVLGADRRHLAAGYEWVLLGPGCLRLRPKGVPPEPPGVKRDDGRLVVRGPAEIAYRIDVPRDGRLRVVVEAANEPARVRVEVDDGVRRELVDEIRVSRGLLPWRAPRTVLVDLARWSERRIRLHLGIYPETCESAFTTAILHEASVVAAPPRNGAGSIDKSGALSR